ncbi:MAG TPA: LOG family protein [Armatimonadota bacterium]|jgi:hypothetical protein
MGARRRKLREMQATAAEARSLAEHAERSLAGLADNQLPPTPVAHNTADLRHQMEEVLDRYLLLDAQLRQAENTNFRVCIFGSARIRPDDSIYQCVQQVAKCLATLGVDIVTGGGPGLMEAANRGVREAHHERSKSYGLPIDLPSIKEVANQHLDIKSSHRRFSSRLDEFMRLSHAVIVAPGGIGTALELMYVWQILQVGLLDRRKVILLNSQFWGGLLDWFRAVPLAHQLVSPSDFDYLHLVDTADQVSDLLREEVESYQALRLAEQASEPAGTLTSLTPSLTGGNGKGNGHSTTG